MSGSLRSHGLQNSRPRAQHQLPEFTQTHVHGVGDAIPPSHPLLSSSPPAFNRSQHQGLFQSVALHSNQNSYQCSKALFPWCFLWKINKQKTQLNRVRRPAGGALTPWAKASAREKPWTLYSSQASPLPFPAMKAFPFLCHLGTCMAHGLPWLQTPSYNSLLVLSKCIFVGETSGSLSQVNTRQMKEYMYVLKELGKMKRMNGKVKNQNDKFKWNQLQSTG